MSSNEPRERNLNINCRWACGLCSAVCPERAISCLTDLIEVDRTACSGCLACVMVCPAGVLEEEVFV